MRNPNQEDKVLRELGNWDGVPCSWNYAMKRAAEMFFPVWEMDKSFTMLGHCCDAHFLDERQRSIVRECLERHGYMKGGI